ncbi:MAG: RIP metalloprotease RseP [bacterium]
MINFFLYSILPFLFILGFCVTIHEFGHFIFAKIFGIAVEKFSIGYGPPLIRMKIGETDFRIAYFPLGGYVKMAGEEEGIILKNDKSTGPETEGQDTSIETAEKKTEETIIPEKHDGFYDAPIYKRIVVVLSGPLFNIFSAFVILFLTFMIYGMVVTPFMHIEVDKGSYYAKSGFLTGDSIMAINNTPVNNWEEFLNDLTYHEKTIVTLLRDDEIIDIGVLFEAESTGLTPIVPPLLGSLKQNGPADKAGMKKGDIIIKINDHQMHTWHQMVKLVRENRNVPLTFTWQHGDEYLVAEITPASFYDPIDQDTIGQIGVFMPFSREYLPLFNAFGLAFTRTIEIIKRMLGIFYQLITRQIPAKQMGGPIAIFKLSTESAQWGFEHLLGLLMIISINLGIINLFPIPALDGGHILIAIIEAIRRKRFSKKTMLVIQQIGYALILLLIIFVTFNDLTR